MTTNLIASCLSVSLALLLGSAACAKLRDPASFERVLEAFGVMRRRRSFARVVPTVELLVAGVLMVDHRIGGVLVAGLLLGFSAATAMTLARGARPDCGCFSPGASPRLGRWTLGRNLLLIAAAILVAVEGSSRGAGDAGVFIAGAALATALMVLEHAMALRETVHTLEARG